MIARSGAAWVPSSLTLMVTVLVTSCAHSKAEGGAAPSATSLSGTWRIKEVGGNAVADTPPAELRIDKDGRASGTTGCNNFTGTATIDGANLSFSPFATTRRACEPPLMDQESRVLGALQSVKRHSVAEEGRLSLQDAAGQPVLRLERASP
jgi:putative lipoprotein